MALSGHRTLADKCPLSGVKRTLLGRAAMSAYDPKRTLAASGFLIHLWLGGDTGNPLGLIIISPIFGGAHEQISDVRGCDCRADCSASFRG
jgi:hypothetical protein